MKLDAGWVDTTSAGEITPAFFARPAAAVAAQAPLPAVVVIHELFGVDAHIEDVVRRLATAGYEVLAPDLWAAGGGRPEALARDRVEAVRAFLNANPAAWSTPTARQEALARVAEDQRAGLEATLARLFGSDEGRAQRFARYTEIARGAVAHLRAAAAAGAKRKVASLGFCMGGGISGLLACAEPTLTPAVVFYGAPPPLDRVPSITCPILGHYADPDPRITPNVPAFAEAMRAHGNFFDPHVYAAPHAFFNDTGAAYRIDAARTAWARTLTFLSQNLG